MKMYDRVEVMFNPHTDDREDQNTSLWDNKIS